MSRVQKVFAAILSLILIICAGAAYLTHSGKISYWSFFSQDNNPGSQKLSGADFSELAAAGFEADSPLIKTSIDGIWYSFNEGGVFSFYKFNGSGFENYPGEVKTISLSPELTYNKIPIKIHYITEGKKTEGYGLFTTANSDADVKYYSFVFARLCDAPAAYGLNSKKLLLTCTDPEQAYREDKTYTEFMSVDMASKKCSLLVSQRDRTADYTGRLTERWNIFTDSSLSSVTKKSAIISGRRYNQGTEIFDVYEKSRGTDSPVIKGMYSAFLRMDADTGAYIYLKKTQSGFSCVKTLKTAETVCSFTGDLNKDYLLSGDWIYNVSTGEITNLTNGKKITPKSAPSGKAESFAVNAGGTLAVLISSGKDAQSLTVIKENGDVKNYIGESIFTSGISAVSFIDESNILLPLARSENQFENQIIKLS